MNKLSRLAVVIIALASVSVAQADPIIFDNEMDFLSRVNNYETEGFEGPPSDNPCTPADGAVISTSLLTVSSTPTGGGTSWLCSGTVVSGSGPRPTEGENVLVAGSSSGDPWILDFVLSTPAIGVYFELTDAAERGDASFFLSELGEILIASEGHESANVISFGIMLDDPFGEFSLVNTGLQDGWGIDNMIFASVPEPGTLALLGIGLAGMGWARRRRRATY